MPKARAAPALSLALIWLCAAIASTAPARAIAASSAAATPTPAQPVAAPRVTLRMRFKPDRPGRSTTIHWGFTISQPTALRALELHLPAGMGFAASSLGLETCEPATLMKAGPEGCPPDSRLGLGIALAEVPAQAPVRETAKVTALLGPPEDENMTVLFFVDGRWPANRELILVSHLVNLASPGGATLLTEVPPLPVWPAGPNIGLMRFSSTIGPEGLTYYRRVHGRTVAFAPRGVTVPKRCPRGGFPVSASFTWWTHTAPATAMSRVPCHAA